MSFVIYHLPCPGDCESFLHSSSTSTSISTYPSTSSSLFVDAGQRNGRSVTALATPSAAHWSRSIHVSARCPANPHPPSPPREISLVPLCGPYIRHTYIPPTNPLKQQAILPCSHSPFPCCIIETFCHFLVAVCLPLLLFLLSPLPFLLFLFYFFSLVCVFFVCCYCVFITAWWLQGKRYVYD